MALQPRYEGVIKGGIMLIGNTEMLSANTPTTGASDFSCYAYSSADTSQVAAPGWPSGTTWLPSLASSSAVLNLPSGSSILYAQMFWVTRTDIPGYSNPLTLNLRLPGGTTIPVTSQSYINGGFNNGIWMAADLTNTLNNISQKAGTYTVSGFPATTITGGSVSYPNSWCMVVAYQNNSMPYRYVNINTGFQYFATGGAPINYNFTGFYTPASGVPRGYLLASNSWGNLDDRAVLRVGPNSSSLTTLGQPGPWNGLSPYVWNQSVFPANVLVADPNDGNIGLLQTAGIPSGTNRDPFNGTCQAAARNNLDILGIDISNTLSNNQNALTADLSILPGSTSFHQAEVSSYSVQIDLNSANIADLTKTVDNGYASVNTTLNYTVSFSNSGLETANNVILMDTLPNGLSFITGSVAIDGVTSLNANIALPGVNLGSLGAGQRKTVTFSTRITAIPTPNPISNVSSVYYNFSPGIGSTVPGGVDSGPALTTVNSAQLTTRKQGSNTTTSIGAILTYTISISNIGNTVANGIIFIDTIPLGTTLVPNTFNQDLTPLPGTPDPPGVLINSINPGGVSTISFKVNVVSVPSIGQINNTASMTFNYIENPTGPVIQTSGINTNTVVTRFLGIPYVYLLWTQINVDKILKIPIKKPDIEEIDSVTVNTKIIRKEVIVTPSSNGADNLQGKKLTGRKLIIEGELCQKTVYTACNEDESIHSAHYYIPFSAYIVVPATITLPNSEARDSLYVDFLINPYIENIYTEKYTPREIYNNVTLLLEAIPSANCE